MNDWEWEAERIVEVALCYAVLCAKRVFYAVLYAKRTSLCAEQSVRLGNLPNGTE